MCYQKLSIKIKQGKEGILDFYLNENGILQKILKDKKDNPSNIIYPFNMPKGDFSVEDFNAHIKRALIRHNMLSIDNIGIEDAIHWF